MTYYIRGPYQLADLRCCQHCGDFLAPGSLALLCEEFYEGLCALDIYIHPGCRTAYLKALEDTPC